MKWISVFSERQKKGEKNEEWGAQERKQNQKEMKYLKKKEIWANYWN